MKKMLSLLAVVFLSMSGAFADAPAEKRPEMLDYIAKLKAQEYVRELVRLKIDLMRYPSDSKASEVETDKEQKGVMNAGNPVILMLKSGIAACDSEIERAKAELEDLKDRK